MMVNSEEQAVARYLEARNYIDVEIVCLTPRLKNPEKKVATVREFNSRLGDPQRDFPSVQVAGTSGKGSVCHYLARMLFLSGVSTGLHVSPYLQVATEKSWVNDRYVSAFEFHDAAMMVKPVAQIYRYDENCPASVHGMASLALSYVAFSRRNIDWCVMETGLGGRFDLVQGLRRELAVVTDVGLDHTDALGSTVEEIAWHKAGIMEGAPQTLAVRGDPRVWKVLEEQAAEYGTKLIPVEPGAVVTRTNADGAVVRLPFLGDVPFRTSADTAGFALRNMAVAATAADLLARRGVGLTAEAVAGALEGPGFPGRMETVQQNPTVILDCAHNHQKMEALGCTLLPGKGRLVVVFGATGTKKGVDFLAALPQRPDHLVLTRPLLHGKAVMDPARMAEEAGQTGASVHIVASPIRAIETALALAGPADIVLVTGSVYLVGQVRSRWYHWTKVLVQQSSYPGRTQSGRPVRGIASSTVGKYFF